MCYKVERITADIRNEAIEVLEPMDPDSNNAHAAIPRFHNLVVDPRTIRCIGADQHNGAGAALELRCDPPLDGRVPATGDRLPLVISSRPTSVDCANVSNLRGS